MKLVHFYKIECPYSGLVDSYTPDELYQLARARAARFMIETFDHSELLEDDAAEHYRNYKMIEDVGPHTAKVLWSEIDEILNT